MRAAVITALTGPDAVEIQEVAEPEPKPNQVVVDVAYAGVVFPDVLQTRGQYQLRPDLPFTPGWEVSGVVRADAGGFRAGDRVAAMPVLGGLAETVAVGPHMVFPLPDTVPFDKGATLPLNYLTVHFALIRRARLKQGEIVLVHGAAGGVGTAACQLAAAYGAQVVAVVSTAAKGEVARAAGAHEVVPVDGFRDQVRRLTDGSGVDVVVDPVGGQRFTDSLRCLAREGRLLVLGFTGREIPTVKVNRLLLTNTTVMGVASAEFWRNEPQYATQQWRELVPLMRSGAIDPPIGSVVPLDQTATAIRELDRQRSWETPEGDKRSVTELEADEVGASLKWATAKVERTRPGAAGRARRRLQRRAAVLMWERLSRCGTRVSATIVMVWMVEAGCGGGRAWWSA